MYFILLTGLFSHISETKRIRVKRQGLPPPGPAPSPINNNEEENYPCPTETCWIHTEESGCEIKSESDCGHSLACTYDKVRVLRFISCERYVFDLWLGIPR